MSEPKMRVNKKLIIVMLLVLFTALACNNNQIEGQNNIDELKTKEGKRKFKNYIRPIVIDTAVFYYEGEKSHEKQYHINAYSEIDTANIEFYTNWYDSILTDFKGGRESIVYFFDNKQGTPKISFPALVSDKAYEEHCFLLIKYERGALKHYWDPFK